VKTQLIPCDDNYGGNEITVRGGQVETTRYYNIETTYQCADCEKYNVMVIQNHKGGVRTYNVLVGEKYVPTFSSYVCTLSLLLGILGTLLNYDEGGCVITTILRRRAFGVHGDAKGVVFLS